MHSSVQQHQKQQERNRRFCTIKTNFRFEGNISRDLWLLLTVLHFTPCTSTKLNKETFPLEDGRVLASEQLSHRDLSDGLRLREQLELEVVTSYTNHMTVLIALDTVESIIE